MASIRGASQVVDLPVQREALLVAPGRKEDVLIQRGGGGEPMEFVCAWVEPYEKIDGTWRLWGNASSFRPQP